MQSTFEQAINNIMKGYLYMLISYLLLKTNLFPRTSKIRKTQVLINIEMALTSTYLKHKVKHEDFKGFLQNV